MDMLVEIPLYASDAELPPRAVELIEQGLQRSRTVDCFDFVPSDYAVVYRILDGLTRGRFCEWGSGMGIATGLAALLGFEACGVEIHPQMAEASRRLLEQFQLPCPITTGDYFQVDCQADTYFTYCWPGQMLRVEERFVEVALPQSRLLICHGADDVRCKRLP